MSDKAVVEGLVVRLRKLETQERSEVTGGVRTVAFAALPAAGQAGRLLFVSDGRKLGEAPAAGTGVLVYDDGGATWRRPSDDTTVAV